MKWTRLSLLTAGLLLFGIPLYFVPQYPNSMVIESVSTVGMFLVLLSLFLPMFVRRMKALSTSEDTE